MRAPALLRRGRGSSRRSERPANAWTRSAPLGLLFAGLAVAACTGIIGGDAGDRHSSGGPSDGSSDTGPEGAGGGPNTSAFPALRRLTRRQYVNSVKALLGIDVEPEDVPAEVVRGGHGQIAAAQEANYEVVDAYYEVGMKVAQAAVGGTGCKSDDAACAARWAEGFLRRAFRGPVEPETKAMYTALLEDAEAGDTIADRLVTLIATALTSPYFLYRQEIGTGGRTADGKSRVLTHHEIATRLSYLVWGRGPDDELLAAADTGRLLDASERLRQVDRLLAAPQASEGLQEFVRDWMGLYAGGIQKKDPEVLANTSPKLAERAELSFGLTVDEVLMKGEKSFAALLSTSEYVVDDSVGPLVGVEGASATMSAHPIDTKQRVGLLMHPTVLAAHTKESGASPFQIGKFVFENVLCNEIGAPPVAVTIPADATADPKLTLRQRLEQTTAAPTCQACHAKIGPAGYAFLPFDPIGRYSASDKLGRPWDTRGSVPVGNTTVSFDDAVSLSQALARDAGTARCVALRMFRWAYGRFETADDQARVDALERASVDHRTAVRDMLAAVVGSDDFTLVPIGAP